MITRDNFGQVLEAAPVEVHAQNTPSSVWTIAHNRGREIIWRCYESDGVEVWPDVNQSDVNQAVITFLYAATGRFVYK